MNISLRELGRMLGVDGLANLNESAEQTLFLFPSGMCFGGIVHREPETDEILLQPAFSVMTDDIGQLVTDGPKQALIRGRTKLSVMSNGILFSGKNHIEIPVVTQAWNEFFLSICEADVVFREKADKVPDDDEW